MKPYITPGHMSKRHCILQHSHMLIYVHFWCTHKSYDTGIIYMPMKWWMKNKISVLIQNWALLSCKKDEIIEYAGKCIVLDSKQRKTNVTHSHLYVSQQGWIYYSVINKKFIKLNWKWTYFGSVNCSRKLNFKV